MVLPMNDLNPSADAGAYDRAYPHLVESNDDLVGLLAYALFAQHREDLATRYRRGGAAGLGENELAAFTEGAVVPRQVEAYRARANEVLARYAEAAIGTLATEAGNRAVAGRIEAAARRVEKAGGWWRAIPAGIVASILTLALLIGLVVGARYAGIDLGAYLGGPLAFR